MVRILMILIASVIIFGSSVGYSEEVIEEPRKYEQRFKAIEKEIEINSREAAAVRRDQLNYKIEKDLLKEAYASNLTTVNTIITLILGAFTIIGVIGVRSIENIKKEFRRELDQLISIKNTNELQMGKVVADIEDAKSKYTDLVRVNEEQNGRLRLIEAQERAASSMRDKNYQHAIKYIDIGLLVSEKDLVLNKMKYNCLMKLGRLAEAEGIIEYAMSCEPDNRTHAANLVELSILLGKNEKARRLMNECAEKIFTSDFLHLRWYFEALMSFMEGNIQALKANLRDLPAGSTEEKVKRMNWSYVEARHVLGRKTGDPGFKQMAACILFLDGERTLSEFMSTIEAD